MPSHLLVEDKAGPAEVVYTPEHVARLLKAAWRLQERRHVHFYVVMMLSTHGRGEAVLELDADRQIRGGLIPFPEAGAAQTKKRRSIVPIAPTLTPWLEGSSRGSASTRRPREAKRSGWSHGGS